MRNLCAFHWTTENIIIAILLTQIGLGVQCHVHATYGTNTMGAKRKDEFYSMVAGREAAWNRRHLTPSGCDLHFYFLNFKFLFIYYSLFILRERKRESTSAHVWVGEGQRERERENPKQALLCQHRAWQGARHRAQNHEPVWWPEPKSIVGCLAN